MHQADKGQYRDRIVVSTMCVRHFCKTACALQTMPTDMRALQDFEDEDKLQIQMNDVITIIEGRSV